MSINYKDFGKSGKFPTRYTEPEIRVLEINLEHGFAASRFTTEYSEEYNGGDWV